VQEIVFRNRNNLLVGNLFLPPSFSDSSRYESVIVVGPSNVMYSETSIIYAKQLSLRGFVTLCFDPTFFGKSSGLPRDLEDPETRVEDIKCAVDYLLTLPFVDEEKISLLGICTGGGYAVKAATTDYRISALATIVGSNIGSFYREILGRTALRHILKDVSFQRTVEVKGGEKKYSGSMGSEQTIRTILRSQNDENGKGNQHYVLKDYLYISLSHILAFDSFHMISDLLFQPLQVIVGENEGVRGSYQHGMKLFYMAGAENKDFYVVEGARHNQMCFEKGFIENAVDRVKFFLSRTFNHL